MKKLTEFAEWFFSERPLWECIVAIAAVVFPATFVVVVFMATLMEYPRIALPAVVIGVAWFLWNRWKMFKDDRTGQ